MNGFFNEGTIVSLPTSFVSRGKKEAEAIKMKYHFCFSSFGVVRRLPLADRCEIDEKSALFIAVL
jgi:hypothetical protein